MRIIFAFLKTSARGQFHMQNHKTRFARNFVKWYFSSDFHTLWDWGKGKRSKKEQSSSSFKVKVRNFFFSFAFVSCIDRKGGLTTCVSCTLVARPKFQKVRENQLRFSKQRQGQVFFSSAYANCEIRNFFWELEKHYKKVSCSSFVI